MQMLDKHESAIYVPHNTPKDYFCTNYFNSGPIAQLVRVVDS